MDTSNDGIRSNHHQQEPEQQQRQQQQRQTGPMSVGSDEINFLVYRYLQESGESPCGTVMMLRCRARKTTID